MRKFHPLSVVEVRKETDNSVRVALQVPDELRDEFDFLPGQHLPIQIDVNGVAVRRTYSICSLPGNSPLQIGIRIQPGGRFSEYAANEMQAGDVVQVMPPFGQFHASIDPSANRVYLAFAAGSGITPIMSILGSTLEKEPNSKFVLFYGNRLQRTSMFVDELCAMKNSYPERLQLYFLFTQEEQEFEVFSGRMDAAKTAELCQLFCVGLEPDAAFICGPDTMIESVRQGLTDFGMAPEVIHAERFGAPRKKQQSVAESTDEQFAKITVIMDGHKKSFEMSPGGANIVDAAAEQGIDLPFSCKGGVCATCRTHVREGKVRMDTNYGLESWELDKGYVLACQSHPVSESVILDYDKA